MGRDKKLSAFSFQLSALNTVADARGSRLVTRIVVADRPRRPDRCNRVLEDHVIGAALLDDHGKAIEVLDATLEIAAVHEADLDRQLLAARVIQNTSWILGWAGAGRTRVSVPSAPSPLSSSGGPTPARSRAPSPRAARGPGAPLDPRLAGSSPPPRASLLAMRARAGPQALAQRSTGSLRQDASPPALRCPHVHRKRKSTVG